MEIHASEHDYGLNITSYPFSTSPPSSTKVTSTSKSSTTSMAKTKVTNKADDSRDK